MQNEQIKEFLNKKKAELNYQIQQLEKVLKIQEKYPDLDFTVNRGGMFLYASKSINGKITQFNIYAGGCDSQDMYISPYMKDYDLDVTINSYPREIFFGMKPSGGYGVMVNRDWREKLTGIGLSENIIKQVEKYIEENPPRYFDEIDSQEDDE